MIWHLTMDSGFVVGGDPNQRLTPNFRLREFMLPSGQVRVHRELVSALQILRGYFGRSLNVGDKDADGLGATVSGTPRDLVKHAADSLMMHSVFASVTESGDGVHVRIPDPAHLPEIQLEQALETAFSVTSGFETSGDRFQQVTGNFDGAGLSFGPAQWNFASGTLTPLFNAFRQADENALRACFTDEIDYAEWLAVLERPASEQIAWANGITAGRAAHEVVEPWKAYLQAVGRVPAFRAIMVEQALRKYGAKMLKEIRWLQNLAPGVQINHLRCMCALYDLVIQQGSLEKARNRIEERVANERPTDQFTLVAIAVEERGLRANKRWRSDCVSRRLGILHGFPHAVNGWQRANLHFYLLRDVCIRDAQELMSADVSEQLAAVSRALATGRSVLA